jgi:hypothetical protein
MRAGVAVLSFNGVHVGTSAAGFGGTRSESRTRAPRGLRERESPAITAKAPRGRRTPTEIADAQASLTRAQENYLNARYNYLTAMDRLQCAMGVGQTPRTHTSRHTKASN